MKSLTGKKFIIVNIIIIALLVLLDRISKILAQKTLVGNDVHIIKDVLHLHLLEGGNKGAAWGMLQGKQLLFVIFTLLVIVVLFKFLYNLSYIEERGRAFSLVTVMFDLLIAGAIGNLIDRIFEGSVTDFIYFVLIDFPIFNVADIYITISCIALVIVCLFFISGDEFEKVINLKKRK